MATGDLQNNVERVIRELRNLRDFEYESCVDGLRAGSPGVFARIIEHVFMNNSVDLARYFVDQGYTFLSGSTKQILDMTYRIARVEFSYKPQLSEVQFMKSGHFVEAKLIFLYDIIRLAGRKSEELEAVSRQERKTHPPVAPLHSGTSAQRFGEQEETTTHKPRQRLDMSLSLQTNLRANPFMEATRTPGSSAPLSPVSMTSAASAPAHFRQYPIRATSDVVTKNRNSLGRVQDEPHGTVPGAINTYSSNTNSKAMESWVSASPQRNTSKKEKSMNKHLSPRPRNYAQDSTVGLVRSSSTRSFESEPPSKALSNAPMAKSSGTNGVYAESRSKSAIHRKLELSASSQGGAESTEEEEASHKNQFDYILHTLTNMHARMKKLEDNLYHGVGEELRRCTLRLNELERQSQKCPHITGMQMQQSASPQHLPGSSNAKSPQPSDHEEYLANIRAKIEHSQSVLKEF